MNRDTVYAAAQPLETTSLTREGTFSGYAVVFGDFFNPGAFTKTLAEAQARRSPENPGPFKLLRGVYNTLGEEDVVGEIITAEEDPIGLWVTVQLAIGTHGGNHSYGAIKRGKVGGLTIAYQSIKTTTRLSDGQDRVSEARLISFRLTAFATADPDLEPLRHEIEGLLATAEDLQQRALRLAYALGALQNPE